MTATKHLLMVTLIAACAGAPARGMELQRETVDAWRDYVHAAGQRMQARLGLDRHFLWTDDEADRARRIRGGEIVVEPGSGDGATGVPNGLIHDWTGAVFIPHATIDILNTVLDDYDRYDDIYKPAVETSHRLACTSGEEEFTMTWFRRVLFVNAAMQGWYRAREFSAGPDRRYSIVESIRIQQIENFRHQNERFLAPDTGNGFIWRIQSIVRAEQRDGGVYLEIEAIALTRDIPPSVAWMVKPVVRRLAMNSLTTTLRQTRDAVTKACAKPERLNALASKRPN